MKQIQLTLTQWTIITLLALVGILAIILRSRGKALKELKLKLMQKDLEISIEKDDKNVAEKKKALRKAKRGL